MMDNLICAIFKEFWQKINPLFSCSQPPPLDSPIFVNGINWNESNLWNFPNNVILNSDDTNIPQIIISHSIYIENCKQQNILSKLLFHVYRCNLQELWLENQIITFPEYMKLISGGMLKCLHFINVLVIEEVGEIAGEEAVEAHENYDGKAVTLENLVKYVPIIQIFKYVIRESSNPIVTNKTAKKLENSFLFAKHVYLHNLPTSFDLQLFGEIMKDRPKTYFDLTFSPKLSESDKDQKKKITEILRRQNNKLWISFAN